MTPEQRAEKAAKNALYAMTPEQRAERAAINALRRERIKAERMSGYF